MSYSFWKADLPIYKTFREIRKYTSVNVSLGRGEVSFGLMKKMNGLLYGYYIWISNEIIISKMLPNHLIPVSRILL